MSEVFDHDEPNRMHTGLLGVQVHVGPPMTIEFRDIFLKHLSTPPEGSTARGEGTYQSGTLLEPEHQTTFENLSTQAARLTAPAVAQPVNGQTELVIVTEGLAIVRHDLTDVALFGASRPMSNEQEYDLVVLSGDTTIRIPNAGTLLSGPPPYQEYRVELRWNSDQNAYEVGSWTETQAPPE